MYKIIGADLKEYGPISADQLRQWISEGRVNGDTKVLLEGTTVWKRMAELPEFASALPAPAQAAPASVPPAPLPPRAPTLAPGMPLPVSMPPAARKSNQLAIWAMVTGIIGFLCCQFLSPVAIVLGMVALSQIKQRPGEQGSGFAITGIVLGIISLIVAVIVIIVLFSSPQLLQNLGNPFNQ